MLQKKLDCKIKLDLLHGFGSLCSQGLKNSVCIIDEDQNKQILFPIGRFFALKDFDKSDEQFIKLPQNTLKLISMAVSPNRKLLAASVQLRDDVYPLLLIYEIQNYLKNQEKEKMYRFTDTKSQTCFTQIAFSGDSKFLVCMTGAPSFQVLFLDIQKQIKQISVANLAHPINKLSIHPTQNHTITLSGLNVFKILKVIENQFKQLNEISNLPQNQNFTDHQWLNEDYLIIGTNKGTVYIVENYSVQEIFENCLNKNDVGVTSIACFKKGFLVGSDKGIFALYMKLDDEKEQKNEDYKFMLKRTFMSDRKSSICHISISSKQDLVAVSYSSNDIATFELTSLLIQTKTNQKHKDIYFDYLFNGFHSNQITSLDICLQRPLIVTCSKYDSSIRVWNYIQFRCELARKFFVGDENSQTDINYNPLMCVAFHPFGYYLAVGFVNQLRFFHLLHSELRSYKEILLKNTNLLKYSNGGQYLAAAYNKNKTNIYFVNIYNSYTAELISSLKGHSNVINDIQWDNNDQFLYTVGNDGNIFLYDTRTWVRKDFVQSDSKYSSMIFSERDLKLVVGQENGLNIIRELRDEEFIIMDTANNKNQQNTSSKLNRNMSNAQNNNVNEDKQKISVFPLGQTQITCMNYLNTLKNQSVIMAGCDQGYLRMYNTLFNQRAIDVIATHDGQVNKVITSPDGRYVFSAGSDGSLFIFQVSDLSQEGNVIPISNIINETNNNNDYVNNRFMIVDQALADVILVSRAEIDSYLNMQRQLRTEIEDLENKIEQKHYDEKEKLYNEKSLAENKMHQQIESFNMRYEDLKQQKQEVEKDYNNLLKNMENNHLKAVEELENLYEKKLAFENEKFIQLESKMNEMKLKHSTQVDQLKQQNKDTLQILENSFKNKFGEVQGLFNGTKESQVVLIKEFKEKLEQQEEEYELEIEQIKNKFKVEIDNLKMDNINMSSRYEILQQDYKNIKEDLELNEKNKNELENQIMKLNSTIQEQEDRVKILQKEQKEQEENIKKKDKKIYEYKYVISDLQKAKHVLSFRTAEMRNSIEPKEAQIAKLKEELFKLEQEFEKMLKINQQQNDTIKKYDNQVKILQNNLNEQVEQTKSKQNLLNKMIMDIYNCVNSKDIKQWPIQMKQLYQNYVIEQDLKQVKQDPKGVEERQRQIQHLENCIDQIHVSSNNIIKRREIDIRKKTMENAVLIYDLSQIRKKNKEYDTELTQKITQIEHKDNEIKKLKNEMKVSKHNQMINENNKIQQPQSQSKVNIQQNNFTSNSQNIQSSIIFKQQPALQYKIGQGGIQTSETEKKISTLLNQQQARKMSNRPTTGKLYKGSNFDKKTMAAFDKAKIMDLMIDLENGANRIQFLENEIKKQNLIIQRHVNEKGCNISMDDNQDHSNNDIQNSEEMIN